MDEKIEKNIELYKRCWQKNKKMLWNSEHFFLIKIVL
jgi:hypothetical protein